MDRIHPESLRELGMLVQLHGTKRLHEAVDQIGKRLEAEYMVAQALERQETKDRR